MFFTSSSFTGPQKNLRPSNRPPHTTQLVAPEEPLGAGDSRIMYDLLPPEIVENAYGKLVKEVEWIRMVHRGMWPFQLYIPRGVQLLILIGQQEVRCQDWSPNREKSLIKTGGKLVSPSIELQY